MRAPHKSVSRSIVSLFVSSADLISAPLCLTERESTDFLEGTDCYLFGRNSKGITLHMAECELSVLRRQSLRTRVSDIETVREKAAAWEANRNQRQTGIDWQFTTDDARIKLKRLYPIVNVQ